MRGEAKSEIGVLGHIARIPEPNRFERVAAKEVAGPAEGKRPAKARQKWQQGVKVRGVFERELPGQPVPSVIVPTERGLQAGQPPVMRGEHFGRRSDLAGMGHVLGVIDAHDRTDREAHREIERARLGARLTVRHDDNLEARIEVTGTGRLQRFGVDCLDDQFDVELVRRVFAALCSKSTKSLTA